MPEKPQKPADWPNGPHDEYSLENQAYHLVQAGKQQELRQLLMNFHWIQARLNATDVISLSADYEYLSDDKTLILVRDALRLSAHVLNIDKTQLPSQLLGRFRPEHGPEIHTLCESIKQY
ncbi:MAG: hypothetical protein ACYTBZ_19890 [Planctomycetota bacterium]|jgi:hypothetical protein